MLFDSTNTKFKPFNKNYPHIKKAFSYNPPFKTNGFSLVEMLMALLVASLLLAALAPVITRRLNDSMTISVEGEIPGKKTKTHEITYQDCLDNGGVEKQEKDKDGNTISEYCEGIFTVPSGYNGSMKVTAIGAGGGGGVAATAGYIEYTTPGNSHTFTVPVMVNKIEATLVSAGNGGGAGGQTLVDKDYKDGGGQFYWNIPDVLKNKYASVTACGGGGGGGGSSNYSGGGGGSGGYKVNQAVTIPNAAELIVHIGGGGGAGGGDNRQGRNGHTWDGGGGGSGVDYITQGVPSSGGSGGNCIDDNGGYGGKGGNHNSKTGGNGATTNSMIQGGTGGNGGGKGGDTPAASASYFNASGHNRTGGGGGGGGSYQGGGGGGAGAGSGGGGGGLTTFYITGQDDGGKQLFRAPGGGGGGGGGNDNVIARNQGGGGGGGGGNGGGAGGNGGGIDANGNKSFTLDGAPGLGGTGGNPGTGTIGGQISTIFGNNRCSGGDAGVGGGATSNTMQTGSDGKDGAMRISYLSYGTGGSGGGSGAVFALYPINVAEKETLKITVGEGGKGGTAGYLDKETNGTAKEVQPTEPNGSFPGSTYIQNNSNKVLAGYTTPAMRGGYPGNSKGTACGPHVAPYTSESGWIISPFGEPYPTNTGMSDNNYPNGFFSENGRPAGGGSSLNCNASSIANETVGGRGGTITTPFTGTCTPGKGGTKPGEAGGNASGYGCGGGGGYGLSNGGNGSGGYARISWNKYWDAVNKIYKYADTGAAGGGASGNVMTYTVANLHSGERIKIRIGKGGSGAYISNNNPVNAKNGGDTVFAYDIQSKRVSAGGGNGGASSNIDNSDTNNPIIKNGTGGSISNMCLAQSGKNFIDINCSNNLTTNCCIKGLKGGDGITDIQGAKGGNGADSGKSSSINKGGSGGTTGADSQGRSPSNTSVGAGGGGAGILDIGVPSISTSSNNKGGDGANGKLILEWWE